MAADHQRLAVTDRLHDPGTPIDAVDAQRGRQALRRVTVGFVID